MKECLHDFKTNEDYSDFCSKGCGETFQNYNTKLRNERITKLESDLARVTELLREARDLIKEGRKHGRHSPSCNIYNVYKTEDGCDCLFRAYVDNHLEFLAKPEIKEILK